MARRTAGLLATLAVLGAVLWWLQARATVEPPDPAPRVVAADEARPRIDLVVEYDPPEPVTRAAKPSPAPAASEPALGEPSGRNAELVRRLISIRDRMEAADAAAPLH